MAFSDPRVDGARRGTVNLGGGVAGMIGGLVG